MNIKNNAVLNYLANGNLILLILAGFIIGTIIGLSSTELALTIAPLGSLFINGLKAVAPILVFALVTSAIATHKQGADTSIRPILFMYIIGTLAGALVAVSASFLFPNTLLLDLAGAERTAPGGVMEVISTLIFNMVVNPIDAILNANYVGILTWSILLGVMLQKGNDTTKHFLKDMSDAITQIVHVVIRFAPFGIMALIAETIATNDLNEIISNYGQIVAMLVGCMLIMALIINPLIVFIRIKRNPYPLVFRCLVESGIPAFLTRSSAANVPVNLELCRELKLSEDTYSVSIPLGATVNMTGSAITISIMAMAAANTMGIEVSFATAILLCVLAAVSACGASGVPGGSLLLIPLACSLFGIDNDVAMQVVAITFIFTVVQDSFETALNSSTDVLYTAAACIADGNMHED